MTTITATSADKTQAIFLKAHLKLMAVGMTNSKMSKTAMLQKAAQITGILYKVRGIDGVNAAIKDLDSIIKS